MAIKQEYVEVEVHDLRTQAKVSEWSSMMAATLQAITHQKFGRVMLLNIIR